MLLVNLVNHRAADSSCTERKYLDGLRCIEEKAVYNANGSISAVAADNAGNTAFGTSLCNRKNIYILT